MRRAEMSESPSSSGSHTLPLAALNRLLRHQSYPQLMRVLGPLHSSECADLIGQLEVEDQCALFEHLPDRELSTQIFMYLDPFAQAVLLPCLPTSFVVELAQLLPPDDATDILQEVPASRLREVQAHLTEPVLSEVASLLAYDPETAGGIMTPQYIALATSATVDEALSAIRENDRAETVFYIYVVDEADLLLGVLSLRQLVISAADTRLDQLMEPDVISTRVDADQEQVADLISQYDLLALPVVDYAGCLVGIVTVDDVIDVIREETTEDLLRLAGVNRDDTVEATSRSTIRHRLPWLFVSWIGGLLASLVIDAHHQTLQQVALLAAFFPIIIGMGGNTATQSLAVAIRSLATSPRVSPSLSRALYKEGGIGLALGLIYGVLLGSVAFAWQSSIAFGLVVGISIWAAMTTAALMGGLLPLLLDRLRIDPAVASGPILTTAIDVIGLFLYLATARLFLLG